MLPERHICRKGFLLQRQESLRCGRMRRVCGTPPGLINATAGGGSMRLALHQPLDAYAFR